MVNFKNVLLLLAVTFTHSESYAQSAQKKEADRRNNILSGEIILETEGKKKDPYLESEEAATAFFSGLQAKISDLSKGNISALTPPDAKAHGILTALYLYCIVEQGSCPFIPESILEADLINARIAKNSECPISKSFWKSYVENDMENRHKYMSKIAFLNQTSEFNRSERPKFIRCSDTIKKELEGKTSSDAEFFRARYQTSAKSDAALKSLKLLKQLKDKNINIYQAVGMKD